MRVSHPDQGLTSQDRVPQPEAERLKDYILTEYPPVCPLAGKLHSVTVLRHFLRTMRLEAIWPVVERVRAFLGDGQTVWGVKQDADGAPGVELYFYNDSNNGPANLKTITQLTQQLAPVLKIDGHVDESIDYFMVSLELDAETMERGRSPGFRLYVNGNRSVHGYDGISYLVTDDELRRENYYLFYRAGEELPLVKEQLGRSLRSGDADHQRELLWEPMCDCYTICFATKRFSDALYFSRVDTAQLVRFVQRHMPGPIADMIRTHQDDFAHLRWDVGIDFTTTSDRVGSSRVLKAGLYGFV